jgi:hypothetical protein
MFAACLDFGLSLKLVQAALGSNSASFGTVVVVT